MTTKVKIIIIRPKKEKDKETISVKLLINMKNSSDVNNIEIFFFVFLLRKNIKA
jgi:hypothetical protein